MATKSPEMKIVGRYMVMAGLHRECGETYGVGDIVGSITDLERFNAPGMKPKFQRIHDARDEEIARVRLEAESPPVNQPAEPSAIRGTLESMTIPQLRDLAVEEEIDLGDATKKDEIVDRIEAASLADA